MHTYFKSICFSNSKVHTRSTDNKQNCIRCSHLYSWPVHILSNAIWLIVCVRCVLFFFSFCSHIFIVPSLQPVCNFLFISSRNWITVIVFPSVIILSHPLCFATIFHPAHFLAPTSPSLPHTHTQLVHRVCLCSCLSNGHQKFLQQRELLA